MPADEMPPDPLADDPLTTTMGRVMEQFANAGIFATTAAYRDRMLTEGFSIESAEAMAVDFHRSLIADD